MPGRTETQHSLRGTTMLCTFDNTDSAITTTVFGMAL